MIKNLYDNKLSYSGELFLALYSLNTDMPTFISKGERVAQLIPAEQVKITLQEVDPIHYEKLADARGKRGGLGSTGSFGFEGLDSNMNSSLGI